MIRLKYFIVLLTKINGLNKITDPAKKLNSTKLMLSVIASPNVLKDAVKICASSETQVTQKPEKVEDQCVNVAFSIVSEKKQIQSVDANFTNRISK